MKMTPNEDSQATEVMEDTQSTECNDMDMDIREFMQRATRRLSLDSQPIEGASQIVDDLASPDIAFSQPPGKQHLGMEVMYKDGVYKVYGDGKFRKLRKGVRVYEPLV